MNVRNIGLIFRREVADQFRDRRTLFMIAVLPVFLYPALGMGMLGGQTWFRERPRTIVILGANQTPSPGLLENGRFADRWFRNPIDAKRLIVVTDVPGDSTSSHDLRLLESARQMVQQTGIDIEQPISATTADESRDPPIDKAQLSKQLAESGFEVLIVVPKDFGQHIEDWKRAVTAGDSTSSGDFPRPVVFYNSADQSSSIAHGMVREALRAWEQEILKEFLRTAKLSEQLPHPVNAEPIDFATKRQQSGNFWSVLFPMLLVIMSLTGAFYPAIDLCAGEKERGTMETLLICPASRTEIVLGKFLTVMLFSVTTALLNLSSLGFTGKYMVSMGGGAMSRLGDISLPPLSALVWVLVILIPLSALFSALCLAFATFARSSKEGQYYLTPLLMVTMGLTIYCTLPGIELQPFTSVMPVTGPALLLKGLLEGQDYDHRLLLYVVPVLMTSFGYCTLALWWAIDQFSSEDVLFREAERFDLRLWIRHLLRDKEPTPTFSEAVFCFVLIMLLQFGAMRSMQGAMVNVAEDSRRVLMLQILIIQQLTIIATPALLMGVMLVADLRKTFLVHWPRFGHLLTGAVLAAALHPLSRELGAALEWFFPELPVELQESLKAISTDQIPLWLTLLAFAVAPAFCEEIAFRGFLLSGFRRSGRTALAIVLSSLLFGIMHMIPQQVFNAALLGLMLGYIAVRTDSLLPCVAFHFVFNSLEVLRGRLGNAMPTTGVLGWLFSLDEQGLRYQPLLLLFSAAVVVGGVLYLKRGRSRRASRLDAATSLLTPRSVSGI